jgi:two-component system LytT family response regulator
MMRIAIVDDEPLARSGVATRLAAHADVTVVGEYGDGASALAGIRDTAPDVVFIDVQMPDMTGIDVLAALSPAQRPMAILLTAYDEFAVRAFEFNAIDYLLKPVDDDRFAEALDRARAALPYRRRDAAPPDAAHDEPKSWTTRFEVRVGRRIAFVDAQDVSWIEADGDYAALHVGDNAYLVRESLQRLSLALDPAKFVRVHRSTIVRIDRVADLQPLSNRDALLRLTDGTPIRASRTYIAPLLDALRGNAG